MSEYSNKVSVIVAAIAIVAMEHIFVASARGADLPETVVLALKSNAAALDPVTVSWKQSRSSPTSLEELLQLTKQPDEKAFFHPENVTVTFQGNAFLCFRKQIQWEKRSQDYMTWYRDCRFDGKALYTGNSMERRPLISVEDLNFAKKRFPNANRYHAEYFVASGFKVHNKNATIERPPESDLLYLVDHGGQISNGREVVIDSRALLSVDVLRADGRTRFLLDPSMQYAVYQSEQYNSEGTMTQKTTNGQFVELSSPHVWLPKHCRVDDYTWWTISKTVSTQPIVITNIEVEQLGQQLEPETRFVIDLKPGATVFDSRPAAAAMPGAVAQKDGGYSYRLVPTAEDIASAVAVSKGRRGFVWIVCTALFAVILGMLIVRKYRRQFGVA
jgi:hypothetical protein